MYDLPPLHNLVSFCYIFCGFSISTFCYNYDTILLQFLNEGGLLKLYRTSVLLIRLAYLVRATGKP